jgi:GTP-binding protein HflX
MGQLHLLAEPAVETALLVGVQQDRARDWDVHDSVGELAQLCETAGAQVVDRLFCRIHKPTPATFIGQGKALEIADICKAKAITTVVFDDDLSPAQGRNLEKLIGAKVVDRTQVILDIFAQHARSREGQMQIELAQLEYLLPRLKRMWTHLERQKGGIGLRGPGETQLEVDRRRILDRIVRFRRQLNDVRGRRAEQRRGRRRHGWALVSLVGYTNAGKSTLLNALTGADVLAYDQLFATLDPTTRKLELPNHQPALLTDTVGFIRKLPHHLVESFKATLEEIQEADLLMHVIDAAHPLVDEQIEAVMGVLRDLGVHDKPMLCVLNKMDVESARQNRRRLADRLGACVAVSAIHGDGFDDLRSALADALRRRHPHIRLRVPIKEGRLLAAIRSSGTIFFAEYSDEAALLEVAIPASLEGACAPYASPREEP